MSLQNQLPDNDGFTTALPVFLLNMKEEGKKVKKGKKKQVNKVSHTRL